jgi:large subunit ribosomal protein L18
VASLKKLKKVRTRRIRRVRSRMVGTKEKPRLSVSRSARSISVQAIADDVGSTIAAASTLCKELRGKLAGMKKKDQAKEVGKLLAQRLRALNVQKAVFDRGRFLYHGRVKALAEAVRESGITI